MINTMADPSEANKDINLSECLDESKQPLNDISLDGVDDRFKLQQHKSQPTQVPANDD